VPSTWNSISDKNIIKRKLPEPRDGWKDHSGTTHRVHYDAMHHHKTISGIFEQIMENLHEQSSNGSGEPMYDILLARLVSFKEMQVKWETFSVNQLLEMGINCVHEAAHSLYINHLYNVTVAETFLGDDLFEVGRTISVEERVDIDVKRVQKLTATSKATVGQSGRGGNTSSKRGGGRRGGSNHNYNGGKQQHYNIHGNYKCEYRPNRPLAFGLFNGHGSNNFGGTNGGGRGNGGGACFICGSTGIRPSNALRRGKKKH
jgi:hypothetical protein